MPITLFRSFLQAGFECTVTTNMHGVEIDHLAATRHLERIDTDYSLLKSVGILTVREGIPWRWAKVTNGYARWNALDIILTASKRHGLEVIFDLCHFGYPLELDIFSEAFIDAFAEYCYGFAKRVCASYSSQVFVTPINEASYFAWAAGEAARFPPFCRGRAAELKIQLVRAALAGTNAMWSAFPEVRIVSVDPICRTVPPKNRPDLLPEAERFNFGAVFESWDMLAGKLCPELGGSPKHLGILGVNYYWTNQWELGSAEVPLPDDDERRWSLQQLIRCVWVRYNCPVLLSETAHIGEKRGPWMRQVYLDAREMLAAGIPLHGVCLYPVLGMPSWHSQENWLQMGVWDLINPAGECLRVPCTAVIERLQDLRSLDQLEQAAVMT